MNQIRGVRRSKVGLRALVVALAGFALALSFASPASAQPKGGSDSDSGDMQKSLVFIDMEWTGFVNYTTESGERFWYDKDGDGYADPIKGGGTCTGFFVSTSGHIATAKHCVEVSGGKEAVLRAFMYTQGFSDDEVSSAMPGALVNWKVEGETDGSDPALSVAVIQPQGDIDKWETASVRPLSSGDYALLKIEAGETVPLPIATEDPKVGTKVRSIGYPGTVTGQVDTENLEPTVASGTVTGHQTHAGVPITQVDSDILTGMSGGPTVDENDNVLGTNVLIFFDQNSPQTTKYISDTTDFREYLISQGVTPVAPNSGSSASQSQGPNQGPASKPLSSNSDSSGMAWWVWVLIGLVVLAAAGGGVFVMQSRIKKQDTPSAEHRATPEARHSEPQAYSPPPPHGDTVEMSQEDRYRAEYEVWRKQQGR